MRQGIRAAAAYAASAMPAFPAVGTQTPGRPSALARVTAIMSPRALKLAVGLMPSSFTHSRRTPISCARWGSSTSGVIPSPSVTAVSPGASGSAAA
jgi:hypothetical protein